MYIMCVAAGAYIKHVSAAHVRGPRVLITSMHLEQEGHQGGPVVEPVALEVSLGRVFTAANLQCYLHTAARYVVVVLHTA